MYSCSILIHVDILSCLFFIVSIDLPKTVDMKFQIDHFGYMKCFAKLRAHSLNYIWVSRIKTDTSLRCLHPPWSRHIKAEGYRMRRNKAFRTRESRIFKVMCLASISLVQLLSNSYQAHDILSYEGLYVISREVYFPVKWHFRYSTQLYSSTIVMKLASVRTCFWKFHTNILTNEGKGRRNRNLVSFVEPHLSTPVCNLDTKTREQTGAKVTATSKQSHLYETSRSMSNMPRWQKVNSFIAVMRLAWEKKTKELTVAGRTYRKGGFIVCDVRA